MITFFNDYKTFHLLKYEASMQNIPVNKAMENALIKYIQKQSSGKVEELPKGKMKAWMAIKEQADKNNCTVAEFIERAIVEYCGLNAQVSTKQEQKKSGSIFDLNRDVNKK